MNKKKNTRCDTGAAFGRGCRRDSPLPPNQTTVMEKTTKKKNPPKWVICVIFFQSGSNISFFLNKVIKKNPV